jgi:inner membrane protein
LRSLGTLALLGALPDIDFLVGRHSRESHSIGAVAAVGLVAWLIARRAPRSPRAVAAGQSHSPAVWAWACALAYASHIMLDWLGSDTSPPIGIQALWPFSNEFYQSGFFFFYAVDRRFWLPGFVSNAMVMLGWELMVLAPLAGAVCWLHGRRPEANDQ